MLEAEMRFTGNPHYESNRVNVYDEDKRTTFCPLCRLEGKVIREVFFKFRSRELRVPNSLADVTGQTSGL